jgi:hypothetical protein
VRLAFGLVLVLVILSPPAFAAEESGWQVVAPTTTFFAGDWINISIVGPRPSAVPFLYFNLSDPNGTLIDQRYIQVINGSANFSFLLPLEAAEGNYLLNASSNDTLIAQVGFTVQFDELNYLSKRVAYQERRYEDLARRQEILRQQNRQLQAQVDGYFWLLPFCVAVFVMLYIAIRYCVEPVWMYWQQIQAEMSDDVSLRGRFLNWFINYYSPSEREYYHPALRLMVPDRRAVARIAELSRLHPYSPLPPRKVRRGLLKRRRSV